jgi:hypothetical protein
MSRTAHAVVRSRRNHSGMDDRGFHRIQDELTDSWLEDWAGAGVAEIEEYLAKHAAFLSYLETHEAA